MIKKLSMILLILFAGLIDLEATAPNRYVKPSVWEQVSPYVLPDEHPAKPVLDALFADRVTFSAKTLKKAGFENPEPREFTHVIVTKHPEVPGYVFKIYVDVQRYFKNKPEYKQWLERIRGAQAIRELIAARGWEDRFKVPQKWMYQLPEEPSPPEEFVRKNFILVEEDMEILGESENYDRWKSSWVTEDLLLDFYTIVNEVGLRDCKPDNMAFSIDGRIAFIDTQSHHNWPVASKKMASYLSKDKQAYWKQITKE